MTRILNNLSGMFTDAVAGIDDRLLALLGAGGSGTQVAMKNPNTRLSRIRTGGGTLSLRLGLHLQGGFEEGEGQRKEIAAGNTLRA